MAEPSPLLSPCPLCPQHATGAILQLISLQISFSRVPASSALWGEAERSFRGGRNIRKLTTVLPHPCGGLGVVGGHPTPSLAGPRAGPGFGGALSFGGALGSVRVSWSRRVSPSSQGGEQVALLFGISAERCPCALGC